MIPTVPAETYLRQSRQLADLAAVRQSRGRARAARHPDRAWPRPALPGLW